MQTANARMRAKFKVTEVAKVEGGEKLQMSPVCPPTFGEGGTNEDNDFARWTPSGEVRMFITNPNLHDTFKPGQTFYVDFTRVD